jgi:bacteriocin-like protein
MKQNLSLNVCFNDEKKEGKEMEELNEKKLENVNGGIIVQGESYEGYFIIDPKTGDVIGQRYHFGDAENFARSHDQSVTVINKEQYKKRYGKDIGK